MTTSLERRLPHVHALDTPIFLTWRLAGTLPAHRVFAAQLTSGQAFVTMDRLLDEARTGPRYLSRPDIAAMIEKAIEDGAALYRRYELHAYVIMPNHVHLLLTAHEPVPRLTHFLKRFTARQANILLGRTGEPFWQEESYDRLVRDNEEFGRIVRYIENNPVKAHLAECPEEYRWSSARSGAGL